MLDTCQCEQMLVGWLFGTKFAGNTDRGQSMHMVYCK